MPSIRDRQGTLAAASPVGNPFLFTGREWDAESGLYHYRARTYDPQTGRFNQRDPAGYVDGASLYEYCASSPASSTDPSGLEAEDQVVGGFVRAAEGGALQVTLATIGPRGLGVLTYVWDLLDIVYHVLPNDIGDAVPSPCPRGSDADMPADPDPPAREEEIWGLREVQQDGRGDAIDIRGVFDPGYIHPMFQRFYDPVTGGYDPDGMMFRLVSAMPRALLIEAIVEAAEMLTATGKMLVGISPLQDPSLAGYGLDQGTIIGGLRTWLEGAIPAVNDPWAASAAREAAPFVIAAASMLVAGAGPAWRGSSANAGKGSSVARNLREQLAIEEAMANPGAGSVIPVLVKDARWPASEGWRKMQQVVRPGGREGNVVVHYVRNEATGAADDFKIMISRRR
jgi:RHS repeat-associated protein